MAITYDAIVMGIGGMGIPQHIKAVYQPQGGLLIPEKCITSHVDMEKKIWRDYS